MSGAWIEAARQQMRVVCNQSEVLWKVGHKIWCMFRPVEYGSAADNAGAAERPRFGSICRGSKLDAKRHSQLLEACGPSSSSESVLGQKSQDEDICSRSVAATPLGTRGASGFQRFTRSYHGVNAVGITRPRQEDLCLDGCLRSLLCWLGDTDTCYALLRMRPLLNS
jgi:hypothetical protein